MLDKVAQQITSFFFSIILVIKKKICSIDKFDLFFFLCVQQRDFDGDNITKLGYRTFK